MKRFGKITGYILSAALTMSLLAGSGVNAENINTDSAIIEESIVDDNSVLLDENDETEALITETEDVSEDVVVDVAENVLADYKTTLAVNPSGWSFSPSRPAYIPLYFYGYSTNPNRVEPYYYRLGGTGTTGNYKYINRKYFDVITVNANRYSSGSKINFQFFQNESNGDPSINTTLNYTSYNIPSDNVTAVEGTYTSGSASKFPTVNATYSITNPNSAWRRVKTSGYEIQLKKLILGAEAQKLVASYATEYTNYENSSFRWVFMQFEITSNSSADIVASNVIEAANGNCMLMKTGYTANPLMMPSFRGTYQSPENATLSSHSTRQVVVAALIPKDVNYPMIKLKDGSRYTYIYTYPSYMDVTKKITAINFDKSSIVVGVGQSGGNSYTITPADAEYTTLAWSSSNTAVATVDSSGRVTGVKEGTATITAKAQDGGNYSKSYTVTVKSSTPKSITITDPSSEHIVKKYYSLNATVLPETAINKEVAWSCDSSSVRFLTAGSPEFTALFPGTYTITATSKADPNVKASYKVTFKQPYTVTIDMPKTMELQLGELVSITATITPDEAKMYGVEYVSANSSIVSVISSNGGYISAAGLGTTTVTLKVKDGSGASATCTITVVPAKVKGIDLQSTSKIEIGETEQLNYTVQPSTAANKSVTWTSSNTAVATVDTTGKVTGKSAGTAVITAKTVDGGFTAKCTVTVSSAVHDYLTGSPLSVTQSDPLKGFSAKFPVTPSRTGLSIYQKWYAVRDGETEVKRIDLYATAPVNWKPAKYGIYNIYATAEIDNVKNSMIKSNTVTYEYHPHIKGICQIPYEGGGYLIGIESYDNPNGEYSYELLVYNCSTNLWEFRSMPQKPGGNCLWTVWQPVYGYFWTLFRVYDKNGNIIDEMCYGFANVC